MAYPIVRASTEFPDWYAGPIYVTLAYGQSRADNRSEGTDDCYTPTETALSPQRCLMMDNNAAPGRPFESDFLGPEATQFIPFVDGRGILGSSNQQLCPLGQSLGVSIVELDRLDVLAGRALRRRLYVACGEGGQKVAKISKPNRDGYGTSFDGTRGTYVIYDRMLRIAQRIVDIAAMYGRAVIIEAIVYLQHEADMDYDAATDPALWQADTLQLWSDMRADLSAITGQTDTIPLFFDIGASWASQRVVVSGTSYNVAWANDIIIKQVENALAGGDNYCTGMAYGYGFAQPAHMGKEYVTRFAEAIGQDIDLVRQGGRPDILRAESFEVANCAIHINCHVPVGTLRKDPNLPAMTGTSQAGRTFVDGFEYLDSGDARIIATRFEDRRIILDLSNQSRGAVTLRHAYHGLGNTEYYDSIVGRLINTPGSWGIYCDGRADPSTLVPGAVRRNHLAPFNVRIAA